MATPQNVHERVASLNEVRIRWILQIRLLPFILIQRVKVLEALKHRNLIHCLQREFVMNVAPVEGKISFLPDSATEFKFGTAKIIRQHIKSSSQAFIN